MAVRIRGIGVATPSGVIRQETAAHLAAIGCGADASSARAIAKIYRGATVTQRGSVLGENGDTPEQLTRFYIDQRPTTADRMARYTPLATELAHRAATACLDDAGWSPDAITHLVTVSCTGFESPGVDLRLMRELGLRRDVKRAQIGFMGCHAALNALHVATSMTASDAAARVLVVCVELCSLHFQWSRDVQQVIASSLFADGAGAIAISSGDGEGVEVVGAASCVLEESGDDMTWRIGDDGFVMSLSRRVPELIGEAVGPWVDALLGEHGLERGGVAGWVIHPGGPKIITAVGEALGLGDAALESSRQVLRDHGNMSSPTVLFILDTLRRRGVRGPVVMMAFGPGLTAEAALLRI
jgi:predicted naringenin-chalcone synthase